MDFMAPPSTFCPLDRFHSVGFFYNPHPRAPWVSVTVSVMHMQIADTSLA